MILYLDSSSLAKLYINEEGSEHVHEWRKEAKALVTSKVAYPETVSALTRRNQRHKNGDRNGIDNETFESCLKTLQAEWSTFGVVDLDEIRAGDLVLKHKIRGFDAVHLAAALEIREGAAGHSVFFTSADRNLNEAAHREQFEVPHPTPSSQPRASRDEDTEAN